MIDLNFEKYTEQTLTHFKVVDSYDVQYWKHWTVRFELDEMPEDLIDPEALIIANQEGEILQIILHEEGCDSPNYQFTENEKKQLTEWFLQHTQENGNGIAE